MAYGQRTVNYTHGGPLDSTAVEYYWYNKNTQELYLRMKGNKKVYGYKGVPIARVENLVKSSSKGAYYSSAIKGRYDSINADLINFGVGGFDPNKSTKEAFATPTAPAKKSFRITGTETREVQVANTIVASSLEEAVKLFEAAIPGRKAKSVSVEL